MKKIIALFSISFFCIATLFGQPPTSQQYSDSLKSALDEYDIEKYAIQDKLLKKNLAEAFNYVIFSNSDLVTNASAFGYTQNEEKTTVSVSTNFKLWSHWAIPNFITAGANASGSKNIFEIYSDDSWRNNVSFNIGLVWQVGKASTFFKKDIMVFDDVNDRRKVSASEPLNNPEKYTQATSENIDELATKILNSEFKEDSLNINYGKLLKTLPELKKLLDTKNYEAAYTFLKAEKKKIDKYLKLNNNEIKNYIKNNALYEFDKKNDITYGYSFKWIDFNLSLGNSTYNFNSENVDATILEEFSNEFDITEDLNKLKSVISVNFNHTHNASKSIWYYQFGTSITSGSFLENILINGTPKVFQNDSEQFVLQDEDGSILGKFDDIKNDFQYGSLYGYGAIFFTEKKNFGFNATYSHNYLIERPQDVFYHNNFTALVGPIFRKVKEDKTSLTFGIDIGLENAIYNTKVFDSFTGRIRVGVPFNIFTKKKETKKKS
jgi:hypothetical protein